MKLRNHRPKNYRHRKNLNLSGWHQLTAGYPWFDGKGTFPIPAYSEFLPSPRLGYTPFGDVNTTIFSEEDPYGWQISEMEETLELKPGVERVARQIMEHVLRLGQGLHEYHIPGHKGQNLLNNPYWSSELAAWAGDLRHEHYVAFLPLALSRTQDDKGRVRWTFFGGSEQGPESVFWKGFFSAPGQECPAEEGQAFIVRLLASIYAEVIDSPGQILSAGFRILPTETDRGSASEEHVPLPSWTQPYLIDGRASLDGVRYLLTFRPFSLLPKAVRESYLGGKLHLLPFPGSLVFWGMPTYRHLQRQLPLASQIPMLHLVARHNALNSVRVPQSAWLHEPRVGLEAAGVQGELLLHSYARSNRWDRMHTYEDELMLNPRVQKVTKVLFSTDLEIMGLYDKPIARNCQLWTSDFELLLDGPNATPNEILKAEAVLANGGLFGYRFQFPAMQVGRHEVYWQRLAVAYRSPKTGEIELLPQAPLGYIMAYPRGAKSLSEHVELWPRLLARPTQLSALQDFQTPHDHYAHQTSLNILTLLNTWELLGEKPLPRSFARHLLRISKEQTLDDWMEALPERARNHESGARMQQSLAGILESAQAKPALPEHLTFEQTAARAFEIAYWNDIRTLAQGEYQNKDNADCVQDPVTLSQTAHPSRDLDKLGDYLIGRHRAAISAAGMQGKAWVGELPFRWQTDFDFPLFGGWKSNQEGHARERDILVVIPGKDRSQAIILADHYDTAYMEDLYDKSRGGSGARKAANGADDDYSGTAALLRAAPIYLQLAREGRLERDIWLLHLTGEEFPADCLGARHFAQALIEGTLKLHLDNGEWLDLSATRPAGIFVMDMIAHNRDNDRDIFQISPGKSAQSLQLALQTHLANLAWNAGTYTWNKSPERRDRKAGQRAQDGDTIPDIAAHLRLTGEVRTKDDPASSLYNTDGQIFSDIGAPVVLLMENYDINRSGYHDTHDTLENIDLDYAAALVAIIIETGAQLATRTNGQFTVGSLAGTAQKGNP